MPNRANRLGLNREAWIPSLRTAIATVLSLLLAYIEAAGIQATHARPVELFGELFQCEALYFSLVTRTTVGYQDFVPASARVGPSARKIGTMGSIQADV